MLAVCVNSDRRRFAGCVSVEMIKGLFDGVLLWGPVRAV